MAHLLHLRVELGEALEIVGGQFAQPLPQALRSVLRRGIELARLIY